MAVAADSGNDTGVAMLTKVLSTLLSVVIAPLAAMVKRLLASTKGDSPGKDMTIPDDSDKVTQESCPHTNITTHGSNGWVHRSRCKDCGLVWQTRKAFPTRTEKATTTDCNKGDQRRAHPKTPTITVKVQVQNIED
jgi:hypothetical protein